MSAQQQVTYQIASYQPSCASQKCVHLVPEKLKKPQPLSNPSVRQLAPMLPVSPPETVGIESTTHQKPNKNQRLRQRDNTISTINNCQNLADLRTYRSAFSAMMTHWASLNLCIP